MGSIHGLKFHDVDGDGLKDANEPIIVSWEIEVRDALTGALVTTVLTMPDDPATAENEAGMYWAEGLAPGTYLVSEVVRPGWEQTLPTPPGIHTVTLGPGQVVRGIDFGNRLQPRSVHGQKFHDANGNGVKDSGEPGLAGWEIEVYDSGVLVGTATTMADDPTTGADETGAYWITWRDVLPSTRTFFVREVLQPNWEQTFPAGVGVHSITLGPGDVIEGIDFGNRETPGSIHVQKFEDLNGDGLKQDNEPGLNDWTITITLPDGTRLSELTHTDVLTGEAGWVWFTDLPLGGYIVQEVLQPGWTPITPATQTALLTEQAPSLSLRFGNQRFLGALHAQKFEDLNGDGLRDLDEPGLAGVEICLDSLSTCVVSMVDDSSTLDQDETGMYWLLDLPPGTYTVFEIMPPGMVNTTPPFQTVTITAGDIVTGVDFGNRETNPPDPDMEFPSSSGTTDNGTPVQIVRSPLVIQKHITVCDPVEPPMSTLTFPDGTVLMETMVSLGGTTWEVVFLPPFPLGVATLRVDIDCPPNDTPGYPDDPANFDPSEDAFSSETSYS